MDKAWVHSNRTSKEHLLGRRAFINSALNEVGFEGKIKCPCRECCNQYYRDPFEVDSHLYVAGMDPRYMDCPWVEHGEQGLPTNSQHVPTNDSSVDNGMASMLEDIFLQHGHMEEDGDEEVPLPNDDPTVDAQMFMDILKEAEKELYPGSTKRRMDFIVKMYQVKVLHNVTDAGFGKFLDIIREYFPTCNLPPSLYSTKKIISALSLPYQRIHACINNCMLFWKEHAEDTICAVCGTNRYKPSTSRVGRKPTKVPYKVLRYFPIGPKLQRLYMSRYTAESMIWHSEMRTKDGLLRHPADSLAWKHLDNTHPEFASECRNVRLGLASDGFNPFGNMSSAHSSWPVILSVYNLPPWMCMKQAYLMLSLLIPGPEGPGMKIDVYLQPLIDDLKDLWTTGLVTFDAHLRETFTMRAAVLWTINDFPAYGMLSGWSTHGRKACPTCGDDPISFWLYHGGKFAYMNHRRWLPMSHVFRKQKISFNGNQEWQQRPVLSTALDCLVAVSRLTFRFGKAVRTGPIRKRRRKNSDYDDDGGNNISGNDVIQWKKKSIFFELPYWKDLLIRHNLDVKHIEKNVTQNVLGTLLELDGKNKDGIRARADLVRLGIKPNLHPRPNGDSTELPPAQYNMTSDEKKMLCEVLASVRVPDGYSSNISRCVNVKQKKITGLKSHDYHILMQVLLPIAIRHVLPKPVVIVLLELSRFFRNLCSTTATVEMFNGLSESIAVTLCKLEKLFPPSFFTVMVHLTVHLADEAAIAGPVQYRWMYPIERYLGTLKDYVHSKSQPDACVAEAVQLEDCLSFCSMYLGESVETRRNKKGRNYDGINDDEREGLSLFSRQGKPVSTPETFLLHRDLLNFAHRYVLLNCSEMTPFLRKHIEEVVESRRRRTTTEYEARKSALASFPEWCRNNAEIITVDGSTELVDDLRAVAAGPSQWAKRYTKYVINGYRFKVKSVDVNARTQSSGVHVPADENVEYYGILKDIIELDFHLGRKLVLFQCDWFDVKSKTFRTRKDEHGFTIVNFQRFGPTEESFIIGTQAKQVFYVQEPVDDDWHVVVKTKPRDLFNMLPVEAEDSNEFVEDNSVYTDGDQCRANVAPIVVQQRLEDI